MLFDDNTVPVDESHD